MKSPRLVIEVPIESPVRVRFVDWQTVENVARLVDDLRGRRDLAADIANELRRVLYEAEEWLEGQASR